MAYDRSIPKRPANLSLDAAPDEQCRSGAGNVSAQMEVLPTADLAHRQAAADAEKVRTERAIDAFVALYHEYGSLSEEMQAL